MYFNFMYMCNVKDVSNFYCLKFKFCYFFFIFCILYFEENICFVKSIQVDFFFLSAYVKSALKKKQKCMNCLTIFLFYYIDYLKNISERDTYYVSLKNDSLFWNIKVNLFSGEVDKM